MTIDRIDHIAVAVENLDQAIRTYSTLFGLKTAEREFVEDYDVEIATLRVGSAAIELLEGKSEASPIRKFVKTRGPGLHHVAFVVDDIAKALGALRSSGVALIDDAPRRGKQGTLVAFIHPRAVGRVLYELVQLPKK